MLFKEKYSVVDLINNTFIFKKEVASGHRKCKVCGGRILKGDRCLLYAGKELKFPFKLTKFSVCSYCSTEYLSYFLDKCEDLLDSLKQKRIKTIGNNKRYNMINQ